MRNLLAALAVGLLLWAAVHFTRNPISAGAAEHMDEIVAGLNGGGGSQVACLREGPFPVDTGGRQRPSCRRCEDLAAAGLLTREQVGDPKSGSSHYIYDLTPFGRSVYTTEEDPVSHDRYPRFCFGSTRVYKVVAAQSPLHIGGQIVIGVEYVVEVVDPHPFLFDPKSRVLNLPLPKRGTPALYAPARTTVLLSAHGQFLYADPSYRYGSWSND